MRKKLETITIRIDPDLRKRIEQIMIHREETLGYTLSLSATINGMLEKQASLEEEAIKK